MCKGIEKIYSFWDRLHHMQHSWHRYRVILIQTISTNLTVKSVQNSTCALPNEYLLVMKIFRSIHVQKVSLQGVSKRSVVALKDEFTVLRSLQYLF